MGFNKRIINFRKIEKKIEDNQSILPLFKSDALIFEDHISSVVLDWLLSGLTEEEVIIKIKKYKNENN